MSDAVIISAIGAFQGIAVAIGVAFVNKKIERVHKLINSGLSIQKDEARQLGNKEGRLEQQDIQNKKDNQ